MMRATNLVIGTVLGLIALGLIAATAKAATVTVEWDAVDDSRVGLYVVGFSSAPGVYDNVVEVSAPTTKASIPDLGFETYYIVAKACTVNKSLCSNWSDMLTYQTPIGEPKNLRQAVANLQSSLGSMTSAVAQVVDAANSLK